MEYVIICLLAGLIGFAIGEIEAIFKTHFTVERVVLTQGINADELVAWIENYMHNYEYLDPPTTGEIIRKIRAMEREAMEKRAMESELTGR